MSTTPLRPDPPPNTVHPDQPPDADNTGLTYRPAGSLDDVVDAWRLVHETYVAHQLIPPHPSGLHTVPHALQSRSVVICGIIDNRVVSTLSAYMDQPQGPGLPLDSVFGDELDALRADGRSLMEMGLFADRRDQLGRSIDALLELMRYVCYFGVAMGGTDGVIGVHPRHAPFYTRLFAFEPVGQVRPCPRVADHPVLLLRHDWRRRALEPCPPRGLKHLREFPLAPDAYAQRIDLAPDNIRGTPIEQCLDLAPLVA